VEKHLKIKFPWVFGKKNQIKDESYDRADSVAVGLYFALKFLGKLKKGKK
jgi:hypothetical protein